MEKTALAKELGTLYFLNKAKKSNNVVDKKYFYNKAMKFQRGYDKKVSKATDFLTKDIKGTENLRLVSKDRQRKALKVLLNNPHMAVPAVMPIPGTVFGGMAATNISRNKLNSLIDRDLRIVTRKVDKMRFAKLKAKDALSFLDKKLKKSLETFKPVGERVKSFVPTKSVNKIKR